MSFCRKIPFCSLFLLITCSLLLFAGCKSYREKEADLPDSRNRGIINVSADESFKPVIDELVQVYESNRPGTKIIVHYKPEAECLKDMLVDSIRMIIATRTYNEEERGLLVDSMKVMPKTMTVARDGIAAVSYTHLTLPTIYSV